MALRRIRGGRGAPARRRGLREPPGGLAGRRLAPSTRVRVEAPLTISGDSGAARRVGTLVVASSEAVVWKHVAINIALTATVLAAVLLLGALGV